MKTFEYKGRKIGVDRSFTNNVEYWWAEWKPSNGDQTHTTRRCKDMDEAIIQAKQAIDAHPIRNGTGKVGKVLFAICVVLIIAFGFDFPAAWELFVSCFAIICLVLFLARIFLG